jgi:hypothetical protein
MFLFDEYLRQLFVLLLFWGSLSGHTTEILTQTDGVLPHLPG